MTGGRRTLMVAALQAWRRATWARRGGHNVQRRSTAPASRECMAMEPDPATKFLKFILLLKIS